MRPTGNQQFAIRTILNTLIGPGEFDRLCLGMQVEWFEDGILYVFVSNEDCAAEIETNHSDDLAAAAEQVFSQPIRIVNVLPMDFSSRLKRGTWKLELTLLSARKLIERFNKIKQSRRVATRYDKLAANYLAFINLINMHLAAC